MVTLLQAVRFKRGLKCNKLLIIIIYCIILKSLMSFLKQLNGVSNLYDCMIYLFIFLFIYLAFVPILARHLKDRIGNGRRERGNDIQQKASLWNRTQSWCSEDTASAHGAPALATELPSHPKQIYF